MLGRVPVLVWPLLAALAWGAYGHVRLNSLRDQITVERAQNSLAKIKALETAREEEARRTTAQQEIVNATRKKQQDDLVVLARTAATADKLRAHIVALVNSPSACNPTPAGGSTPASALGGVLQSCVADYRILGAEAQAARDAGLACQRLYDSLTTKK